MLQFVYDNIKVYKVWDLRVHLTEANPVGFVQYLHCISWTFSGYHVLPGVSVI